MMMACLQGSEYSAKWSFMQAWIRPPPGWILWRVRCTSALQALTIATLLSRACLQGSENSAKCSLTHALMRPWPGCNPVQCCWISAAQAWRTGAGCAMPLAGARRNMDAKATLVILFMSIPRPSLSGYPGLAQTKEISPLGQGADLGFVVPD